MSERKDWIVYRENKPYVLNRFNSGRIDYADLTEWSFLDKFFGFLLAHGFLEWAEGTYPNPRQRKNIPLWFLLAVMMQLRLHQKVAYSRAPGVLRSGSILTRLKFNIGLKGGGFNYRNRNEREVPLMHDTLRKYFRATGGEKLERWYNGEVSRWYRRKRGFLKEGVFILDPTYLVLPDNPNYRKAARMPLDEKGHIRNVRNLSEEERKRVRYGLCYQLVLLLHLSSSSDYFLFAGSHLGPGNESGLKEGERLVDDFCRRVGRGVIKLLIVDREYIDGAMISRFKRKHGIDVLVPLKKNMDAFLDAMGLAKLPEAQWRLYREGRERKNGELVREEVMGVGEITSWEGCDVPLYVVLVKGREGGKEMIWALVSTRRFRTPEQAREHYELRMQVEERIDQLKNCWLIGKFTSPNFNLDMAQVVFTVLVYSLLQMYLMREEMQELAHKTIETLQQEERLGKNAVLVYAKGHFGIFDLDEFMDMTLSIEGEPKERLHRWVKKFRAEKIRAP